MKILMCLSFSILWSMVYAQDVQNKVFIIDGNFYIPRVENKIATFCFGSINSVFDESADCRELALGLLSIANNAVKYSVSDGKVIAASFLESRNNYWGGPTIIATEPAKMRSLEDREVKEYFESYGFTYHDMKDASILDGLPLRKAVFENGLNELIFDFAVTGEGDIFLFLVLKYKSLLEVWKLLDGEKNLIVFSDYPLGTDWSKLVAHGTLMASIPLPEEMEEMTTFSLGNSLFVFNPVSGNFYRLVESGLHRIHVGLEDTIPNPDFTLVVNKDSQSVYLLPKTALKNGRQSFRELINLHGIRIPISE